MSIPARLADGGRIDRDTPLQFSFNGRSYTGYQGDTLASALLANGVKVVGRSFKYHRPRGIFTAGEEEPCALLEIGEGHARVPTSRAPTIPLTQGLVANSQNCWPSVNFDVGRLFDHTHIFWPAGFYNKTFKWPSCKWSRLLKNSRTDYLNILSNCDLSLKYTVVHVFSLFMKDCQILL